MKPYDRSFISLVFLASVVAISCVYYGAFLHNFFTYDDFGLIERVIKSPKTIMLGYNYTLRFTANVVWIPLYAFSGLDPFGYNVFSLLLWILNAILLYRFLLKLLDDGILAAGAGFIFAASAVGCDALFWRAASGTLINVTFYLLTLYTYTVFRQNGDKRKWYWSLFFFVLAFFSKEEAASLPLVILLLEWLYFNGAGDFKGVVRRFVSYTVIILASVGINYVVIYHIVKVQSELVKLSKLRPLHSLFSGWTVFFLTPDGRLSITDPLIYVAALLIVLTLTLIKDRRLLIFGFGWIFLTFLPQSLSILSQFEPRYIFSSLSRHLYIPSIGAAIVYIAIFDALRNQYSKKVAMIAILFFLILFLPYNYTLIKSRGAEWYEDGDRTKRFLVELKKIVPQFPPNMFVYVNNPPTGRAYVQQALRSFYKNDSITWIVDPQNFYPRPDQPSILIDCYWLPDGDVKIQLLRF